MLLSSVSVLVVAQSRSEIPQGLMNNPVFCVQYPFFFEYRAVYEIMWKKAVEPGRTQTTI